MAVLTADEAIAWLTARLLPCHGGKGYLKHLWNLSREDSVLHLDIIQFVRDQQREIDKLRLTTLQQMIADRR